MRHTTDELKKKGWVGLSDKEKVHLIIEAADACNGPSAWIYRNGIVFWATLNENGLPKLCQMPIKTFIKTHEGWVNEDVWQKETLAMLRRMRFSRK